MTDHLFGIDAYDYVIVLKIFYCYEDFIKLTLSQFVADICEDDFDPFSLQSQ